ncbi:lipoprotein insertase outer membrane protein LolB [Methylophaga sp.]|uniref:lipoprotein insertase outer membrane protein LolB n=1 Tax=Methylophaga sp. TaxID=2024840 RepID=UPI0025CCBC40|nr:lipoprotein insertase outer membrane protein LolB [Methylophaga sp.]
MKQLLVVTGLLLMTACTPVWQTKPLEPAEQLWENRQTVLKQMDYWSFRGRTVIRQDKEGWNVGVTWQQHREDFNIRLFGPFSQGAVELAGDDKLVTMTFSDGETYSAATPEELLAEVLGWLLPVSALRDWVRGLPHAPIKIDEKTLDEKGRLITLSQAGWQVEFVDYAPLEGNDVPAKIFIEHPQLSIRLVMNGWKAGK